MQKLLTRIVKWVYLTPCFSHFASIRYPSILGQQSGLFAGWQSSTLAQILAGTHRDGRAFQLHSTPPAPTQRPLCCSVPPQSRLGSLSNHSLGQPRHSVSLTSARLPKCLQSLSPDRYRSATECRNGPPLRTVKSNSSPFPTKTQQTQQLNPYKPINKITRLCIVYSVPQLLQPFHLFHRYSWVFCLVAVAFCSSFPNSASIKA